MTLYDIAIIGGGIAGTSAALRARETGASVIVLERGQQIGGAGNVRLSAGAFHLALGPMDLEPDAMLAHINNVTNGEIDPSLATMIADNSKSSIEWLAQQGVEFSSAGGPHGKFTVHPRGPSSSGRQFNPKASPDALMRKLHFRIIEQGGTIFYGARAKNLTSSDDTKHWLIETSSSNSSDLTILATTVIIADGGFQANAQLVDHYLGSSASKGTLRALETAVGDGLTMALNQGGTITGEKRGVYGHILHRNAKFDDRFLPYPIFDHLCLCAPVVNSDGTLYEHKAIDGPELTAKMLAEADPCEYWLILNESLWIGPATAGGEYHATVNPGIQEKGGRVETAPTLEALAPRCEMKVDTLVNSIEQYDSDAKNTLVGTPPYYGIPISPGITFTFPGIGINDKTEILNQSGGAIPGLYAAGSCTSGIHGKVGGGGYMGGLGIALITGKVAAESAAHFTDNVDSALL